MGGITFQPRPIFAANIAPQANKKMEKEEWREEGEQQEDSSSWLQVCACPPCGAILRVIALETRSGCQGTVSGPNTAFSRLQAESR